MRKTPRVLAILSILMVVMFKFQNCAPAPGLDGASIGSDGTVRLVDGWTGIADKISFMSPTYLIQGDAARIEVQGVCPGVQNSELIGWQLVRSDDELVMASGSSACDLGGFQVELAQLTFDDCNSRYEIRASSTSTSSSATTVLRPFCDSTF